MAGVDVLTPFVLNGGSAVLVEPRLATLRRDAPGLAGRRRRCRAAHRSSAASMNCRAPESGSRRPPATGWPRLVQYPQMEELVDRARHELAPRRILLDPAVPDGYVRALGPAGHDGRPAPRLRRAVVRVRGDGRRDLVRPQLPETLENARRMSAGQRSAAAAAISCSWPRSSSSRSRRQSCSTSPPRGVRSVTAHGELIDPPRPLSAIALALPTADPRRPTLSGALVRRLSRGEACDERTA